MSFCERIKNYLWPKEEKRGSTNIELAPEFERRLKIHEMKKGTFRIQGETWPIMKGQYINPLFCDTKEALLRKTPSTLLGMEKVLCSHALQLAQHAPPGKTTIILDLGGMYSLSFLHIVQQPEIHQALVKGQLAFVVSNLGFDVAKGLIENNARQVSELRRLDHSILTDHETQLIQTNARFLHYICADIAELQSASVQVHGKTTPLRGNVGIIHEHKGLCHGWINDRDLPMLGQMLSPVGTFYYGSLTIELGNESSEDYFLRKKADTIGRKNLQNSDIVAVNFENLDVSYDVFVRPAGLSLLKGTLQEFIPI